MGTCRYLLSGTGNQTISRGIPDYSVEVQHRRAWNSRVSMTEHVWFSFFSRDGDEHYEIYMRVGDPPNGRGRPSFIVRKTFNLFFEYRLFKKIEWISHLNLADLKDFNYTNIVEGNLYPLLLKYANSLINLPN